MGDFNMKLKLEMGNLRAENDKLLKSKDEIVKEKSEMNEKFISNKLSMKNAQDELKVTNSKLSESGESCRNLKNLLEASQTELTKYKNAEADMKIEITRLRKESSTQNDASSKTQKDYIRVDNEKKEGIKKIQSMHNEIRDLKSKLQDYEAGKVQDVKKLEDSLTETLKSNKKVQEALEQDKVMIAELEAARKKMGDELTEVKKDKQKVETDQKNLQGLLDKKKQAERELELMVKDLKEKIDKYDVDKKSVMKMEKAKRDAATSKHEQEKKELEDKVEKMKLQFEKVAIESKRKMSRL
jgi:DNA repair exonuclease SbcCD ATPase subunit